MSEDVLHVDFLRVDVTQTVTVDVPITLTGISPAVEDESGVLIQAVSTVSVEALPMDMPESSSWTSQSSRTSTPRSA